MVYAGSIYSRELVRTPEGFPVRLYNFTMALDGIFPSREEIRSYLLEILVKHQEITQPPHEFAIAAAWGYMDDHAPVKAMDIFSYKFDKPWDICNPDVDGWVFKNGIYKPEDREVTCETTTIILGKEAEWRRMTKSLEQYLSLRPDIGILTPVNEIGKQELREMHNELLERGLAGPID